MKVNRILIVDDDPGVRKTISDILRGRDYEPVTAATGMEAIAGIRGEMSDIAVALIDLKLDDMSGLEVMREIKEVFPETECIVITGYASQETAIEAVNLGAFSYIQKPYDIEQLLLDIRRACDKRDAGIALRESEERYRQLVESINDIVYATDEKGIINYISPSVESLIGYSASEIIGRAFVEFIYGKDKPFINDWLNKIISGHMESSEYRILNKSGEIRWIRASSRPILKENNFSGLRGVITDITDRKKAEKALEQRNKKYQKLSLTDGLTKLYNSRHFYDQLKLEIERANRYHHPLTLLVLDVDDFKKYNDSFGHLEGDKVLVQLAKVIQKSMRSSDSAYRYGGEEFTVILPEAEGAEGMLVAERMRSGFKNKSFRPTVKMTVHLTVSIGIAQYTHQGKLKEFIKRADLNMYKAKERGKDRLFFDGISNNISNYSGG